MDAISKKLPDFFKVFLPTYSSERMLVPIAFVAQLNRPLPKNVILQRRSGSRWFVKVVGDDNKVYFQQGWQKFVRDNGVETGDFLVFSYDGHNKFDVILLGHSLCEKEEMVMNIGMAADEDSDADFDASNNDKEGEEVELLEDEEIESLEDEDEDEEEFNDDDEEEEEIELLEDEDEVGEEEEEGFHDEEEEVKLVEDWDEGEEEEEFHVYTDHNEDNEEEEIDRYTGHDEEEEEAETDVHMDHDDEDEEEETDVYTEHDEEEEEETDVHMEHDEEEEEEMMKSSKRKAKRKTKGPRTGESSESNKKGNNFIAEKYIQTRNPYFVPKIRCSGLKYLHIPYYILKDFEINLPPKIRFHDPLGRKWKGEVLKWKDGRTKIKGWKAVCRWNNIKEGHCICELLLRKNQICHTIKVHIIKPSHARRS